MNYIGSKAKLIKFLEESIDTVTKKKAKVFCDLFAGTGVVGSTFKKRGYTVIANDIQYYSYVLNRHSIGNSKELTFQKLSNEITALKKIAVKDRKAFVCEHLSGLKGRKGFIYKNYCLGGTKLREEPRQYYSDENGMRADAIRQTIEEWSTKKLITKDEYFFLLASLIESIDRYANTASVYGAFLKQLKRTAAKSMVMKPAELILSKHKHQVFNENINTVIRKMRGDVVYLDPPYNARQYATNYHVLETIARYDSPKLFGKTGLREYQDQKSLYCSKAAVKREFKDLILNADARYIFLSYNNEGLMDARDIREIMSLRGKYGYFTQEYSRFKADKKRTYTANKTVEYLHYVICDK